MLEKKESRLEAVRLLLEKKGTDPRRWDGCF